MSQSPRPRRSLTNVGGAVTTVGDAAEAALLARALDVSPADDNDDETRAHVHGFHSYPARLHPETASRLVDAFVPVGGSVLDPFCGSGTVPVETLRSGRPAFGVDLNPLAVRLARCKTRPRAAPELTILVEQANACAAYADERRKAKAGASRRFPDADMQLFEPHVLLELDSLRANIETIRDEPCRLDLSLVLSAILVKLSRKTGDTSTRVSPRRTAAGFAARLFVKKTEELARRLAEFAALLSPGTRPAFIARDDATKLRALPVRTVDAIVTSPPYAATYDYVAHHDLRLRWLGLDATPLVRGELGARATYKTVAPREAPARWAAELGKFFAAAARVLPKGGPLVLVLADSASGSVAIRADEIVAASARASGFVPVACASQPRPHFHGPTRAAFRTRPRAEHAILLRCREPRT